MSLLNLIAGSIIHNALPDMHHPIIIPIQLSHNRVSSRIQSDMRSLSGIKLLSEHIISKECVAPYMGARGFPADLNSHLTDSRLPSRAHEKSIEPSTRQTCRKAPLPAQYTLFWGIHPSLVELE